MNIVHVFVQLKGFFGDTLVESTAVSPSVQLKSNGSGFEVHSAVRRLVNPFP